MAKPGDVAENPVVGDRVVFVETAGSTNGELLRFDHFMKIGGYGPNEHMHPVQEEHFDVVSGTMGVSLNGVEHVLQAGEEISVPPGARHTWWNAGDEQLHQITEFRPALEFEVFQETLAALGREKNIYKGLPIMLQFAVLNVECMSNVYVTKPPVPIPVQKVLYPLLARMAKRRGGHYERYRRYALR